VGRRIDKQTNGKYAVWSSVVDGYIAMGATPEEIVEMYVKETTEEIKHSVNREVTKADQRDVIPSDISIFTEI
jgi:methenyltetrahydromethanopterin cyclohydrolase